MSEEKILFKYKNANKAFTSLKAVLHRDWQTDDVIRDSLIQRFEFTVETMWKFYKNFFEQNDYILASPKAVFRELLKSGILNEYEVEQALSMIDDRNLSSHTYDEKLAEEISHRIPSYLGILEKMINNPALVEIKNT